MPGAETPEERDSGGDAVAGRFLAAARAILDTIEGTQLPGIATASEMCARAIGEGGLVHLFGSGHSRIPVEEMFPRYGSYPGFHPIAELSMTFHTQIVGANGQRQAMFIERVHGLAEVILSNFHFRPSDVMMVFSSSGLSAVPIEMAMGSQQRGLPVIAVTSVEHSMSGTSLHDSGTRLLDHADLVIDLGTPPSDAMVWIEGSESPVGPGSTIAAAAIANEIKVQTAARLQRIDRLPPILTSGVVVGHKRAGELFDLAYADHAIRLAHTLGGSEPTE